MDLADGTRSVEGICFAGSRPSAAHVDGGDSGLIRYDDGDAGAQALVVRVTDAQTFDIGN